MHELRAMRRIHHQTWQRYFKTVQIIIQTKIQFSRQKILVTIFCNILYKVLNTYESQLSVSENQFFMLIQYCIFQDV